jgi:hypothetical protein
MKKKNFRNVVIIPTVLALSTLSLSSNAFAKADTLKNVQSQSSNPMYSSESVTIEILKGTNENWKKIKVIDKLNGTIEYAEKIKNNKNEVYKIYSETGEQTHEIIADEDNVTLDGKVISQDTADNLDEKASVINTKSVGTISPSSVVNPGDSLYLISTKNGSYAADWGSAATCASLLSAFFGTPVGVFVTVASYIVSYKIPEIWYTKYRYSDKAPYHPYMVEYAYLYKDPGRTQYIGMGTWYP